MRTIIEVIVVAWTLRAGYEVVSFAWGFGQGFWVGLCSGLRGRS